MVKPIGCKWAFSVKMNSDGLLNKYKTCLVALSNHQESGIDHDETFALVAKMTIVRTNLAIVASQSWPLFQLDVKNAFLHGDLKEVVYMRLSQGYPNAAIGDVTRVKRSLYGLKQAPLLGLKNFKRLYHVELPSKPV